MPPKGKQAANGATEKKPAPAPAATKAESTAPADAAAKVPKPDQAAYQAEQDALKKQIDELTAKLNAVKEKINLSKGGGNNERRDELRAELDKIRGQQASNKAGRGKLLDQLQAIQKNTQERGKALQASKGKISYRTPQDVDSQIDKLNKNVESGSMRVVDEKKALAEISSLRRVRKTVEGFQAEQDAIEAERAKVDELRKQLDDPEAKAVSEQFDKIKAELDAIKNEADDAYKSRNTLFEERTQIQNELEALWSQKKGAQATHRQNLDAHWKKVNEDRAKRTEKFKAQQAADEEAKKKAQAEQILEEARDPAYAAEIIDCQTLIDYFSNKTGTAEASASSVLVTRAEISGVPKLEIRQVESDLQGLTIRKKKGEDEENYFVAKKNPKQAPKKTAPTSTPAAKVVDPATVQLNIPFGTLSGLLALSIPPPANAGDVPRVIEDLKTKKAWYQANQARVTQENVAKAEAQIAKLNKGKEAESQEAVADATEEPAAVEAAA